MTHMVSCVNKWDRVCLLLGKCILVTRKAGKLHMLGGERRHMSWLTSHSCSPGIMLSWQEAQLKSHILPCWGCHGCYLWYAGISSPSVAAVVMLFIYHEKHSFRPSAVAMLMWFGSYVVGARLSAIATLTWFVETNLAILLESLHCCYYEVYVGHLLSLWV